MEGDGREMGLEDGDVGGLVKDIGANDKGGRIIFGEQEFVANGGREEEGSFEIEGQEGGLDIRFAGLAEGVEEQGILLEEGLEF